jgi:hypothetical protein
VLATNEGSLDNRVRETFAISLNKLVCGLLLRDRSRLCWCRPG